MQVKHFNLSILHLGIGKPAANDEKLDDFCPQTDKPFVPLKNNSPSAFQREKSKGPLDYPGYRKPQPRRRI